MIFAIFTLVTYLFLIEKLFCNSLNYQTSYGDNNKRLSCKLNGLTIYQFSDKIRLGETALIVQIMHIRKLILHRLIKVEM